MSILWKQIRTAFVAWAAFGLAFSAPATEPNAAPRRSSVGAPASAKAAPVAVIIRDASTGKFRVATGPEVQALAAAVDRLLDRGTAIERPVRQPNGKTAFALSGNFESGVFARRNSEGKIETACFDEAGPAKRFLGLEPVSAAPASVKAREE